MLAYLFGLAYLFAGVTYWAAVWLGSVEFSHAKPRKREEIAFEPKARK